MEGLDARQFGFGSPPAPASAQRAGEGVELYRVARLCEVHFTGYEKDLFAPAGCVEMPLFSGVQGPKEGTVASKTLLAAACALTDIVAQRRSPRSAASGLRRCSGDKQDCLPHGRKASGALSPSAP
jgi:hypothetical protein